MMYASSLVFLHRLIYVVFKMFAFGTNACFESWMPLVNGCINCALFNAVPNVFLQELINATNKYYNNVIFMSVWGRKK